jgi:hypothetical protein
MHVVCTSRLVYVFFRAVQYIVQSTVWTGLRRDDDDSVFCVGT